MKLSLLLVLLTLCPALASTATAGTTYADAPYGYVSSDQALRAGTFYYNDFNTYTVYNPNIGNPDQSQRYLTAGTALVGNSRGTYTLTSTGTLNLVNGYGTTSVATSAGDTLTANSIFDPSRNGPVNGNLNSNNTDTIGNDTFAVGGGVLNYSKGSRWTGTTSRGVEFDISTAGYTGITLSFDFAQTSSSSSGYYLFRASADGGATWAFSETINLVGSSANTWYSDLSYDLSACTSLNDNASFAFQMVATVNPDTGAFVDVNGNAITSGTASFSLDRVTLSGTAIPEPAAVSVALGLAAGFLALRRRRTD